MTITVGVWVLPLLVTIIAFCVRRPSKPDYDDALRVTVRRRSIIERILGAWWLLRGGDALTSHQCSGPTDSGAS